MTVGNSADMGIFYLIILGLLRTYFSCIIWQMKYVYLFVTFSAALSNGKGISGSKLNTEKPAKGPKVTQYAKKDNRLKHETHL